MAKRKSETETMHVPHEYVAMADRRVAAIVRGCCYDENIVQSVARSCYLQGVWDGVQVAIARPEILQEVGATPR
jgi:hypothetical protein